MSGKRTLIRAAITALVIAAVAGMAAMAAGAGTSGDPLVTLSYLNGTFKTSVVSAVTSEVSQQAASLDKSLAARVTAFTSNLSGTAAAANAESAYKTVSLSAGETRAIAAGTQLLMVSGAAAASGTGLSDTTAGAAVSSGAALKENHLYVASADCTLSATDAAKILMK
ncbi:MAG: hypothetical protein PHS97_00240 [Oscillospiraceae bacterium]|nr:hypothetical protein [Oscillospiraceae bacterium]